jgi:hypothetical protein
MVARRENFLLVLPLYEGSRSRDTWDSVTVRQLRDFLGATSQTYITPLDKIPQASTYEYFSTRRWVCQAREAPWPYHSAAASARNPGCTASQRYGEMVLFGLADVELVRKKEKASTLPLHLRTRWNIYFFNRIYLAHHRLVLPQQDVPVTFRSRRH